MATVQQLLDVVEGELGTAIGDPSKPYAVENSCAKFTKYCYNQVDIHDYDEPLESPAQQAVIFQQQGRYSNTPELGSQIFIDLTGQGQQIFHTGFVVAINPDGTVTTTEFNCPEDGPNTVKHHTRKVDPDGFTMGFGHPNFTSVPAFHEDLELQDPMMHNDDVSIWQQKMADRGWDIDVDGWYGHQSETVCRQFQQEKGLDVDGIVGPITWNATWTLPIT